MHYGGLNLENAPASIVASPSVLTALRLWQQWPHVMHVLKQVGGDGPTSRFESHL